MNYKRYQEIIGMMHEWRAIQDVGVNDALFALYDDRMISGQELDVMMHECDANIRMIRIAEQRQRHNA